jgi:hypothetical protein
MATYWKEMAKQGEVTDEIIVSCLSEMDTRQLIAHKKYFEKIQTGELTTQQKTELKHFAFKLLDEFPNFSSEICDDGHNKKMRERLYNKKKEEFISFNKLQNENSDKYVKLIEELHEKKIIENQIATAEAHKEYMCKEIKCECGVLMRINNTTRHKKSSQHVKYEAEKYKRIEILKQKREQEAIKKKQEEDSNKPKKDANGFTIIPHFDIFAHWN